MNNELLKKIENNSTDITEPSNIPLFLLICGKEFSVQEEPIRHAFAHVILYTLNMK